MRITIKGRRYRLKENVSLRLRGIGLVLLGIACHLAGADGAALFMWFYGGLMLMPDFGKICRGIYLISLGIVLYAEEKEEKLCRTKQKR